MTDERERENGIFLEFQNIIIGVGLGIYDWFRYL